MIIKWKQQATDKCNIQYAISLGTRNIDDEIMN